MANLRRSAVVIGVGPAGLAAASEPIGKVAAVTIIEKDECEQLQMIEPGEAIDARVVRPKGALRFMIQSINENVGPGVPRRQLAWPRHNRMVTRTVMG